VISDTSSLLYKVFPHHKTWEGVFGELQEIVQERARDGVETQVYCGDFYPKMPGNKQVEQELRVRDGKKKKLGDGTPVSPLTPEEISGVSMTQLRGPTPNFHRLMATPGIKMLLLSAFSFRGIMETDMSCSELTTAEAFVDGVCRTAGPLSGDKVPIPVCERRTRNNVTQSVQRYQRDIGEGDVRAMWWASLYRDKWMQEVDGDGDGDDMASKTVLVDFNDSDEVVIFLLNMERFIYSKEDEFDIRVIVRVGGRPWRPGEDARDKSTLVDIGELWRCIHHYVGKILDTRNCIITFSLLLLLAGTDFVKSINSDGVISRASPFRGLGINSLLDTFLRNSAARFCLSRAIVNGNFEEIRGNPWLVAHTHLADDMQIVHFVAFAYSACSKYKECETETSIAVTDSEHFKVPTMEELRSYDSKIVESTRGRSTVRTAKHLATRTHCRLLNTQETLAVARRAFWGLDYWMNGYLTPNAQENHSSLSATSNLPRYGWITDSGTGRVTLSPKVCDIRQIGDV